VSVLWSVLVFHEKVSTGWFLSFRAALAEVPGHAGCGAL
jgi:hypothetical protein